MDPLVPSKEMLEEERLALETDRDLYLECMNGLPLKDRPQEKMKDGFILFHHVYKVCRKK